MSLKKAGLLILIILLIDQASKIYIKTNFQLHEGFNVFGLSWFRIYFIENEGMAWGAKIPGQYGKLILTLFRLVAIVGIGYWLWDSVKKETSRILTLAVSFIFAGAFGNIIDSVFYGIFFNHSDGQVANFMPADGGYASVFYGKVVDMLYFPMWSGYLPEWIPFWGGDRFTFFEPVFNIADASITTGVLMLLVFHRKAFPKKEVVQEQTTPTVD